MPISIKLNWAEQKDRRVDKRMKQNKQILTFCWASREMKEKIQK